MTAAYKLVDENLRREGVLVQLPEEMELNLPFLLPEDGYTCENLRGIPQQLFEFIEPLSRLALCRLFTNPHSLGMWTEFMQTSTVNFHRFSLFFNENFLFQVDNGQNLNTNSNETVTLNKKGNSLGLSIVAAKVTKKLFDFLFDQDASLCFLFSGRIATISRYLYQSDCSGWCG